LFVLQYMWMRSYAIAFGIIALSLTAHGNRPSRSVGCHEGDLRVGHDLRGCGGGPSGRPVAKGDANHTSEGAKEQIKEEGKKLKNGKDGSPTNNDIKKVDKAIREKSPKKIREFYELPLALRLSMVAVILATPLVTILVCMRLTPPAERATNIYVKTALHCGFSFTVGWLNCIMLLRYRVFATMMVGNTILMGVAFVCNGGFSQALEVDEAWWMGHQAQKLCPAQFEDAGHYALMIFLFLGGSFLQGFLFRKFGWSSKPFAPIVATSMIAVEMLGYFEVIKDRKIDVYLLSPIFGMFVSISAHCGVGSVPWAATGHMVSMGFKLGSWCSDFNPETIQPMVTNICLWISFVLGIMMGSLFHSNRTVMLCALSLQGLLMLNGSIFPSAELGKTRSEALLLHRGDGESHTPTKDAMMALDPALALSAEPTTNPLGSRFVPGQASPRQQTIDYASCGSRNSAVA